MLRNPKRRSKKFETIAGKEIYDLRMRLNLTQSELGEKLGISQQAIHKCESTKNWRLSAKTIIKLSKLSGLPAETFVN
jgi:DNA-binding XRE family transcriptional regulator